MITAITVLLKGAIILMFAALVSPLLRRCSASLRYAVWLLAIAGAVVLPAAAGLVPQLEISILPRSGTSVSFQPVGELEQAADIVKPSFKLKNTIPAEDRWPSLAFLWSVGATFVFLRFAMGTLAVRRLAKTASPILDAAWLNLIANLSAALRVRRPVGLLLGNTCVSPMTWGVRRHTILLPSNAGEWPEERRRLVLAHELTHVKRCDGLVQVFVQIACSIYWFNPLMWYAAHRMRLEREHACDDQVLNLGACAADYADHLIQLVRSVGIRQMAASAVSMAQPSQLETRVVSILNPRVRRGRLSNTGSVLLCALVGLVTVLLATIAVTAAAPLPPVLVSSMKFIPPAPAPEIAAKPAKPQRTRIGDAGMPSDNAVVPPQVVQSKPPQYTYEALLANVEGIVTLEAAVGIDGKVTILRVVKGLGYGLDDKAKLAVAEWTVTPATRNGAPVEVIMQIDVEFTIPVWYKTTSDDTPPISIGPGVTPPNPIFRIEPEYTPEAREARVNGTVIVGATIHQNGTLTVDKVVQELGYGLTEKAIEALEHWKFNPGMKDGKAVAVSVNVEVNFNLK